MIISQCLKSLYLWKHVETMQLTNNMRIKSEMDDNQDLAFFNTFLLDLGEGKIPTIHEKGEFTIEIMNRFLLPGSTLEDMVSWVFEHLEQNRYNPEWLCERAILCPTNVEVDAVNEYVSQGFPGEEHIRYSADSVEPELRNSYQMEFLNTLCTSGMPPHQLTLKVGMIVMLLRNFDTTRGHCNGSRYILLKICPHVLLAQLVSGINAGSELLIPRIRISPSENRFPFTLTRKQFPVRPCFAMTVNKSQGQTLTRVGVYSLKDFFSHGQLYVAASRVGNPLDFRILMINAEDNSIRTQMKNVVYKEILTEK